MTSESQSESGGVVSSSRRRRYLLEGKPCRIINAAPEGWSRGMVEVAMMRTGYVKYVWPYALTDMSRPNEKIRRGYETV